jgi:site-specific DNA-methyltransferase (adenine-specific)
VSERIFELSAGEISLRLCREDCLAGIPRIAAPGSVDVVVTSPPYNLGIDYGGYDDSQPREGYLAWVDRWCGLLATTLAHQGSFFLNVAGKPTDPAVPFEVLAVARRHFRLQNVIHWVKSIAIRKDEVGNYPGLEADLVAGHYKPINSRRFLNDCHEYVFHLTKTGAVPLDRLAIGVPYRDASNIARWGAASGGFHCRGNTWFIPYPTIRHRASQRPHPATFPPRLPEMCLRLHGRDRIRRVLDPFLGIGSTAIACAGLELNFLGFELAEDYFAAACARVEEAVRCPSST